MPCEKQTSVEHLSREELKELEANGQVNISACSSDLDSNNNTGNDNNNFKSNKMIPPPAKSRMSFKTKFFYAFGHVYNDMTVRFCAFGFRFLFVSWTCFSKLISFLLPGVHLVQLHTALFWAPTGRPGGNTVAAGAGSWRRGLPLYRFRLGQVRPAMALQPVRSPEDLAHHWHLLLHHQRAAHLQPLSTGRRPARVGAVCLLRRSGGHLPDGVGCHSGRR